MYMALHTTLFATPFVFLYTNKYKYKYIQKKLYKQKGQRGGK